jgi:hypothetical protein
MKLGAFDLSAHPIQVGSLLPPAFPTHINSKTSARADTLPGPGVATLLDGDVWVQRGVNFGMVRERSPSFANFNYLLRIHGLADIPQAGETLTRIKRQSWSLLTGRYVKRQPGFLAATGRCVLCFPRLKIGALSVELLTGPSHRNPETLLQRATQFLPSILREVKEDMHMGTMPTLRWIFDAVDPMRFNICIAPPITESNHTLLANVGDL